MNILDIIILVVLAIFAIKGLVRGLVNEAASLTGLLLGGWLAYRYYQTLAAPLQGILHFPSHVSAFLAFMLILVLTGVIVHIIGNILTAAIRVVMLGSLNRLGGLLLGISEGVLLLSMLFYIGTTGFMPADLKNKIRNTQSAGFFAYTGDRIMTAWRGSSNKKP
jgi:membrane protein required for colicin V production